MGSATTDQELNVTIASIGAAPVTGEITMPPVLVGAIVGNDAWFNFKGKNTGAVLSSFQLTAYVFDPDGIQVASNTYSAWVEPAAELGIDVHVDFNKVGIYKASCYLWHIW